MESWVTAIGAAPIATAMVAGCGALVWMGKHIVAQHEARIEDQREMRELTQQVSAALSANAAAMSASAAAMSSAREAMQVASAVMERTAR